MKVLFDHNVPHKLRRHLRGHAIMTAEGMGWAELVNGQLLKIAEDSGFEVMLTADQSIAYQQNLKGRKLALVVMNTNDWSRIRRNIAPIAEALVNTQPGSYQTITIAISRRHNE